MGQKKKKHQRVVRILAVPQKLQGNTGKLRFVRCRGLVTGVDFVVPAAELGVVRRAKPKDQRTPTERKRHVSKIRPGNVRKKRTVHGELSNGSGPGLEEEVRYSLPCSADKAE